MTSSPPTSSSATMEPHDGSDEHTPLLPETNPDTLVANTATTPAETPRPRNLRTVTFSPDPVTRTIPHAPHLARSAATAHPQQHHHPNAGVSATGASAPPVFAALNSKLRRRYSLSAAAPLALPPSVAAASKIGPQRSTKKTEKLKLLPNPDFDGDDDEESGRDVYAQYTRIKDPTARRDAARLGKSDRSRLPRVTAYCTASRYDMDGLMRFLKGRGKTRGANPKLIDECIYTPYSYKSIRTASMSSADGGGRPRRHSIGGEAPDGEAHQLRPPHAQHPNLADDVPVGRQNMPYQDVFDDDGGGGGGKDHVIHEEALDGMGGADGAVAELVPDFDVQVHTPEVFFFDYGVVVVWGMDEAHEAQVLRDIAKFEVEKLAADGVETEHFNFYYTREYQARIYNDFITLRDKHNYMSKLAISHALAQSVKTSLFEELIASTMETCKDIPAQIALTGKINLSRSQINMQIGELFILRINIHLNGSVLDTPELFWTEPQLGPVYQAVRSYLEMDQRVALLTERLDVIADLLAVLKDQLSHGHDEKLEWIVIVLIAMEIVVAAISIVVDVYAVDL